MLHDAIKTYPEGVEQAIAQYTQVYVECYVEEVLTLDRVNLRVRRNERVTASDKLYVAQVVLEATQ